MSASRKNKLVRRLVQELHAYVPGEQPKISGLIKLNTNENPYPPAPAVRRITRAAVDGRLRLYPNPGADRLRRELARLHHCRPENLVVGNGSDELLALAVRTFVEPRPGGFAARHRAPPAASVVQYFTPSYSLYPVLVDTHGAAKHEVPLADDFGLPDLRGGAWRRDAALSLITTPNAPSGRGYTRRELDRLCAGQRGVVILDEAYVDFAPEHALPLALKHPHVLVARTFSKAYSLCFQRVGYLVGHPDLIAALHKMRDTYNVNGLGQIAAEATLDHLDYYRANFRRIIATREWLTRELSALGFQVLPSATNFILARPPRPAASAWRALLRARKILVRWFDQASVRDYLRITVGTAAEAQTLVRVARSILRSGRPA